MKPIDFRNANFEALRAGLDDSRRRVYQAWLEHGPGTTRAIAQRAGIDLLTFRPRTTDLFQIGLVRLTSEHLAQPAREGDYEAVPQADWERWREAQVSGQQVLI